MNNVLRILSVLGALSLIGWGLVVSDDLSDGRWLAFLFGAWALLLFGTRMSLPANIPPFNRGLIRTALVLTTVFVLIGAQLARIQVIQQDAIYYRTAVDADEQVISNPRLYNQELNVQRGDILDRNGVPLAQSIQQDGQWLRSWPVPAAYPVTGYYSPTRYGSTGLEATHARELSGQAGVNPVESTIRDLLGMETEGSDLTLTIDADLQTYAADLLGDSNGAVVVLDVQTGETLVLASYPTVDPNQLFYVDDSSGAIAYWEGLEADAANRPFVARANQGVYTPGSTFKTITAGIAIEEGYTEPDRMYPDDGSLDIDGRILPEYNRPDDLRDEWSLREGIMWSLNVVLAQVGMQIGGPQYLEYGPRLGFGEDIPYDLPVAESQIASEPEFLDSINAVADTGFGQGELLMSPLHLAMISAMWANGGVMMEPYLVASIQNSNGETTWSASTDEWLTPVSPETASQVEGMMVDAVTDGSIQNARVDGYVIGGKTGTAEIGDGRSHSLFIGFIGDPEPRYAVSVVLEAGHGGLNSAVAIGRDVLVATMQTPLASATQFPLHCWLNRPS